jgi:carbon starvation protein CstA
LGKIGALFAIIGVIACPITTVDTSFRSAQLTIADMLNIKQVSIKSRLVVSLPLFAIGFLLSQLEFSTIWKYLGLANQILSMTMLWTGAMYLAKKGQKHYILNLPAVFMNAICFTYLLVVPVKNGGLNIEIGYSLGVSITIIAFDLFKLNIRKYFKVQKVKI